MSLTFWRPKGSDRAVALDEDNPLPVQFVAVPAPPTPLLVPDIILASAARVATTSTEPVTHPGYPWRGAYITLSVTANPAAAETLTLQVQKFMPVGAGAYKNITAFTATADAVATYLYLVYPGVAETAATAEHEVQGVAMPPVFRVTVTHSAAGSWTYSVALEWLP